MTKEYLACVRTVKAEVQSQGFKLIRYLGFGGGRQVFAGSFVFWRGIERKSSTVHRGPTVRKFVMCESKLRVISCQPAIRQPCGCNELSVRGKMGYF